MNNIKELINIKYPQVAQYRQAQKSLSYVNDVLSGKYGRLETWKRKEYQAVQKEYQAVVDNYQQ